MSPRTSAARCPARRRRFRPRASISAERSIPMTSTPARATGTVIRPVPHPSSSTRPFCAAASRCQNATSRRATVRAFSQS